MYTTITSRLSFFFVFLFSCLLSISAYSQVPSQGFPDDDAFSGRMINVSRGNSSLGDTAADEVLNISLQVPVEETNVTVEIFDGNSVSVYGDTTQGFWDQFSPATATPDDVTFELYRDPLRVGNLNPADLLASMLGSAMIDNDWSLFVDMVNDPDAHINNDPLEDYSYHLVARWNTELIPDIINAFKARVNGLPFLLAGSTIGVQGYNSLVGLGDDLFPPPLAYDGTFSLAAEIRNSITCYIDIYDGDFDRNGDTNDANTDDLGVTNGGFYPFPLSTAALDEAVNQGAPLDDFEFPDPVIQDFIRISPSVNYTVTGSTGVGANTYSVSNDNPSGDREFELFRIASSNPACPDPTNPNYDPPAVDLNGLPGDGAEYDPPQAAPDEIVAGIGEGFHFITINGLDAYNNAFINVSADVVAVGALADFGDAPDVYATDIANNGGEGAGPSHTVVGDLFMGIVVDQELDGAPTALANGDDTAALDDEDGVTFSATLNDSQAGEVYTVDVDVVNGITDGGGIGVDAKLVGWIDFNGNDAFEIGEGAETVVSSTGVSQAVQLQFTVPADIQAGNTYARFRLTTDNSVTLATPSGAALNGEVEDYPFTIESEECIPCKGMKTVSFKMSNWSYYRDTGETVRVRVGDLLGQFGGSDFSAPILFAGTVPNGGTIDVVVPDEHLGKTLTISVEGNSHHVEYGKARFHPNCDLQLWTKSGNSYIEFKVSAFEKNSEETCECVECEIGPAEVTFKITNTYGRDQNETIRVRVGDLSGSLGPNPDDAAYPVIYTGVVANGQTFVVTVPEEHRGKTLSVTVQGHNHTYEYVKSKFHADCDLKVGDTSSLNGYLNLKVVDLKGDTGEICPNQCPPGGTAGHAKDYFSYQSYNNNDGDRDWSGPWEENDSYGGGATGGNVRIYNGKLKMTKTHSSIEREIDLCASTDVWLKFKYVMSYKVDPSDKVAVEVSPDGGSTWHLVDEYSGRHGWTGRSYNISQYASANTRVRFRISDYYGGSGEWFYVAWIKVSSN